VHAATGASVPDATATVRAAMAIGHGATTATADGGREGGRGDKPRGDGPRGGDREGGRDGGRRRDGGRGERRGPSFTPPAEVPQRPKPKRLRPGKQHRTAVLAELPAEQRPIAELALQGMGAVRQRLREENDKAAAEGRAVMPEASVIKLAEDLLPKLRVAEWRDRAEAAKTQADELDLRDLRSVVAASEDPIVARDDTTRSLAEELKQLLVHKQEQELSMWFGDIDAALAVGRVIRALRLSSQPPKAGVPFPTDIAQRLADSTNASLAPMDAPERWAAMLEAAAFSPIRSLVKPARKPDVVNDELTATLARLAPALPHVAELFGIEVDPKAPMPKPLRPGPRPGKGKPEGTKGDGADRGKRAERGPKPRPEGQRAAAAAPTAAPEQEPPAADTAPAAQPSPAIDETPVVADETPADAVDRRPPPTTHRQQTTHQQPPTRHPPAAVSHQPTRHPPTDDAAGTDDTPAATDDAPAARRHTSRHRRRTGSRRHTSRHRRRTGSRRLRPAATDEAPAVTADAPDAGDDTPTADEAPAAGDDAPDASATEAGSDETA
jgi:hypothetical protein